MVNKTKTIQFSRRYMYLIWLVALVVIASALYVAWPYVHGLMNDGPGMAGTYLLILALCVAPIYVSIRVLFGSMRFLPVLAMYCTVVAMIECVGMLIYPPLSASPGTYSVWDTVGAVAPFAAVVILFVCIQNALKNVPIVGRLYTTYYGLTWALLFEMLCVICIQQLSYFSIGYLEMFGGIAAGVLAVWGVVSGRRLAFVIASLVMLGGAGLTVFDAVSGNVNDMVAVEAVLILQCVLAAMFGVMAYLQKR
jgi:hypothetical protein